MKTSNRNMIKSSLILAGGFHMPWRSKKTPITTRRAVSCFELITSSHRAAQKLLFVHSNFMELLLSAVRIATGKQIPKLACLDWRRLIGLLQAQRVN